MSSVTISSFWKQSKDVIFFVAKIALVYGTWRILKYLGETNANFLFGAWAALYEFVAQRLTEGAANFLRMLGYPIQQYERVLIIEGTPGIYVADLCVGIAAFYIFSGLILSFGNHWRNKLWFIPLGWLFIYLVNVLRIAALALVQLHQPKYFNLAHTYVYVVVTYGLIFLLVVLWMEKFAYKKAQLAA
jgi:exosortase/archaeosortase family protein